MEESKVLTNNVKEYYIVKVNGLYACGFKIDRNNPIKLSQLEWDASKYNTLEQAQEIANVVNGEMIRCIEMEVKTRTYKEVK
ncbi:hypothetical protein [Bacillus phage vB_BanS-Thrax1]|nr:hypothetical protein [Bacillus phage vB_BanS-Thrax1]